jgi:wobble nucleotide-excising tRNase
MKYHLVAKFILDENLYTLERRHAIALMHQERYKSIGLSVSEKISSLEAKISHAQKGKEEINSRLVELFGENSIQIEISKIGKNERFFLARNGVAARNLSDGEKTAISFCFFISKLKEVTNLSDYVIYIDDPISSLDSNHVFQINSIIRNEFIDKDDSGKWKIKCQQLFISTHNFEFLCLLKELPGNSHKFKNYFLVKRLTRDSSTLTRMPSSIVSYHSEYHYLYSVIRDFHKLKDKSDIGQLIALPNAVRRFLELYTMARLPTKDNVDTRAEKLFGAEKAKRILKVLHYFSHSQSLDKISKYTDLICDIENAVSELIAAIENDDPRHFSALESALST